MSEDHKPLPVWVNEAILYLSIYLYIYLYLSISIYIYLSIYIYIYIYHLPVGWMETINHLPVGCMTTLKHLPVGCMTTIIHLPVGWVKTIDHLPVGWVKATNHLPAGWVKTKKTACLWVNHHFAFCGDHFPEFIKRFSHRRRNKSSAILVTILTWLKLRKCPVWNETLFFIWG